MKKQTEKDKLAHFLAALLAPCPRRLYRCPKSLEVVFRYWSLQTAGRISASSARKAPRRRRTPLRIPSAMRRRRKGKSRRLLWRPIM